MLDGRDIGTVVCPDAQAKLYITASPEVRARGGCATSNRAAATADYAEILADIERRDARDMGRADSPLKPAPDAHLLDTTEMDIETAFRAAAGHRRDGPCRTGRTTEDRGGAAS